MATITVFSDSSDGRIVSGGGTTYSTVRGVGVSLAVDTTSTAEASGQSFTSPNYVVWELFLSFDTTTITGTVSAATLRMTVSANAPASQVFTTEARSHDWGAPPLTTGDWIDGANLGADTLVASLISSTSNTNGVAYNFTDVALAANIVTSGFTRLVLSSDRDRLNTTPITDEFLTWKASEFAGTTDDPQITLTFTVPAASGDIQYPVVDAALNAWTTDTGGTSNLIAAIDEVSPSDADYIQSPIGPVATQYYETLLQSHSDPLSSTGHIAHYRYQKNVAAGSVDLTVGLYQSTTLIASWAHTNISNAWTTQNQTLTAPQADSITDYSDLRLRFTPLMTLSDTAPAFVADRASANSNATVTTVDLVLASMTIGNKLVLRIAADNSGTGGAARTCTLSNQVGTPINVASSIQITQNNDPGAASAGVTAQFFICPITATSGTLRLTYSGAVVQACVAEEWSGVDTTLLADQQNGVNSTNLASLLASSVAVGYVAYGSESIEGPSTDTYTQDADTTLGTWSNLTKLGTTNATADTNMTVYGGYKTVTATGAQTYNPTINTARDSAGIFVEFTNLPTTIKTQVSWANLELPASAATNQRGLSTGMDSGFGVF